MGFFSRLFGSKSSRDESPDKPALDDQEAVLVHLDGTGLPDDVYQNCDLETIEDQLTEVIDRHGLGEFDGNEIGETATTLYMYGPDAEKLFAGVEAVLRAYPLCQGARVEIRRGGPGAQSREVRL